MDFVKKNAPGILICLVIAVPAWLLGQRFEVVGGPVFAILIGMMIALFWKDQKAAKSGITYTSKKILQLAVVLLGFGMNLSSVLQVGGQSLPIIVSTIATSLIVAFVLYKALHMDANISTLIGVGSSICGGSAIAATAPVIGADDEEIAQAISVIFLFNVIAALIFPTLGGVLGLSNEGFGLFAGTAVNDTSSVTAAAAAWDGMHSGANTLDTAAIVKMTRTLAIIPITLVLALLRTRREGKQGGARRPGGSEEDLPLVRAAVPGGVHHHHRAAHSRGCGELPEECQQVLHRHGYGGHRSEHRHRKAGEDRRQAHLHGLLLLGGHRRRQPAGPAPAGDLVKRPAAPSGAAGTSVLASGARQKAGIPWTSRAATWG